MPGETGRSFWDGDGPQPSDSGVSAQFVPDATLRIQPLLPQLLPETGHEISMNDFMEEPRRAVPRA